MQKISKSFLYCSSVFLLLNLLFSCFVFSNSLSNLEAKRFERYRYLTKFYAEKINMIFLNEEEKLTRLAARLEKREFSSEEILAILRSISPEEGRHDTITIYLESAGCLIGADIGVLPLELRHRVWYQQAVKVPEVVYGEVYRGGGSKGYCISMSKRIFLNGKLYGVICEDLYFDDIFAVTRNMRIGKAGYAFIVAQDGSLIAHPKLAAGKSMQEVADGLLMPLLQAGKDGKIFNTFYYDGQEHLYGIRMIGRTHWALVTKIDDAEVLVGVFWEAIFFSIGSVFLLSVFYGIMGAVFFKVKKRIKLS